MKFKNTKHMDNGFITLPHAHTLHIAAMLPQ